MGELFYAKNEGEKNYMSYSSTSSAHKLNHGDIYNNSNSGVTTEVVTNAFNMVKARLQAAGLTPPGSSDILGVAENFYIKAELVWKGRMMGDLPSGANGSMSTYDNVNKSYAMFLVLGDAKVDEYIKYASTNVQPSDVNGQIRSDYVFNNLKLNQNDIAEPVNIDGDSLADEQRS